MWKFSGCLQDFIYMGVFSEKSSDCSNYYLSIVVHTEHRVREQAISQLVTYKSLKTKEKYIKLSPRKAVKVAYKRFQPGV